MQFLKVLKNNNFNKLWFGQMISFIGDQLAQMACLGWLINTGQKTGSEMAYILFFFLLPSLFLGQLAGIWADKLKRRQIMIFSDIFRALIVFIMAFYALKGNITNWQIYTFAFCIGIGSTFFYPAKLAILPNIVQRDELPMANALSAISGKMATLIGTYLAGILIEKYGINFGFIIDGFSFIISAICLSLITLPVKYSNTSINNTNTTNNLKTAWNYLQKHKKAKSLIYLSALLSLLTPLFYTALTSIATEYFGLGTAGIGKLHVMLGVGMIIGAFIAVKLMEKVKISHLIVLCFSIILITTATSQFVNSFNLAWIWLSILGAANAILVIILDTLLQKIAPDRLRGKVFGFRSVFNNIIFLGSLLFASQFLKFSSAFVLFKIIALVSLIISFSILIFDNTLLYFLIRTLLKVLLKTCFFLKIEGKEYLRFKGGVILAGNHESWLDAPVIGAAFKRPICFLAAQKVFTWFLVGKLMKKFNFIPVEEGQGKQALNVAVEQLKTGKAICIFPEGKLSTTGEMQKFNRGVARLHKLSGAPILPFAIEGGFEAWSWNEKFPKFHKIKIKFGAPIIDYKDSELNLLEELRQRVIALKADL